MASKRTDDHKKFFGAMGRDLAMMREQLGHSQSEIAHLMGWSRFAMSKIETGETDLSVFNYLRLLSLYETANPSHPGLEIMRRYGGRRALTST